MTQDQRTAWMTLLFGIVAGTFLTLVATWLPVVAGFVILLFIGCAPRRSER